MGEQHPRVGGWSLPAKDAQRAETAAGPQARGFGAVLGSPAAAFSPLVSRSSDNFIRGAQLLGLASSQLSLSLSLWG